MAAKTALQPRPDMTNSHTDQPIFSFTAGASPLLVSVPHAGTHVSPGISARFTESAGRLPDTDWHLDRLYQWVPDLGGSLLVATHSRYIVDLNRPPDDQPLYQTATTGLFPTEQFDGSPVYLPQGEPSQSERAERAERYYWPYHDRLSQELQRIKQEYGFAVLFDAHSILSNVPRLFEGQLPDINIGTNDGASASSDLTDQLVAVCAASNYSHVLNGRFRGGYITRYYGRPDDVQAVQLELVQRAYMREDGSAQYDDRLAEQVQQVLRAWVKVLVDWRP